MDVSELNEQFAIPGVLHFDQEHGLTRAVITTPAARAHVFLHGAHLTDWQPTGQAPALFLSSRSPFAPDKAIRGGVPVIFPWFGPDSANRDAGKPGPMHGFARIQEWTVAFAALAGEDLHLTLTLGPSDLSRSLGFDRFRLAFELTIGRSLTMALTVANETGKPFPFEEALHTYLAVADVRRTEITGLEGVSFLDKTDEMKRKSEPGPLTLTGRTDRVYLDTSASAVAHDAAGHRAVTVSKENSKTTVVWNPWAELARTMADLDPEAWPGFLCIETVNAGANAVTLPSGATHTMRSHISLSAL